MYNVRGLSFTSVVVLKNRSWHGVSQRKIISVVYNPVSIKTVIVPPPERAINPLYFSCRRLKFEGQKRVEDLFDGLARTRQEMAAKYIIGDGLSDFVRAPCL